MLRFLFISLLTVSQGIFAGAPELAAKGIESYRDGKYRQARSYFTRSLQEALLLAREDWVAKAALNLIDLELDALNLDDAGELLERLPGPHGPGIEAAFLWKSAQHRFYAGKPDSAFLFISKAAALCTRDDPFYPEIQMDYIRIELDRSGSSSEKIRSLETRLADLKKTLPENRKNAACLIEALLAMKQKKYSAASGFLARSVEFYRAEGALPHMAQSLSYLALSLFMEGRQQEALETNIRAVAAYEGMEMPLPALRAYSLNFLITTRKEDLEKLQARLLEVEAEGLYINLTTFIHGYLEFADLPFPSSLSAQPQ